MKPIIYGYVRVSTDNQLENYSIEEQSERIKAYCAAKDWELTQIYTDGGYSGGNINRPALQQMLKDIKNKTPAAIVVYKLDRLSRSQKDTLTLIEDEFLKNDVDFISINENFDTSSPFGRAMIGILSVFAQLEKDQITERFTMGRIARAKAGYFHGGGNAPLGYDYINGNLTVNEYEKLQVQEVFKLFLEGKSINSIMKQMAKQTGKSWTASKVANILRNSLYIGKIKFFGTEYTGQHQPIIDVEDFLTANKLLNTKNSTNTSQKAPFRAAYLLSGLIYCSHCGAKYTANHGYYKCYSRAKSSKRFIKDPNCKNENWPISNLDNLVITEIKKLLNQPPLLNQVAQQPKIPEKININTEKIQLRLSTIDKELERLLDLYQLGNIPLATISVRTNLLHTEQKALQAKLATAAKQKQDSHTVFLQNLDLFSQNFDLADLDTKRLLIGNLIKTIDIDGQQVNINWHI